MSYTITGLGNAFTDCLMNVPDTLPAELNIEKGAGDYARPAEEMAQLKATHGPGQYASGGSVANTLDTLSKLGTTNMNLLCCVGTDEPGMFFHTDATAQSITMPDPQNDVTSSELLCLITPDGQRTFASVGATGLLNANTVTTNSSWVTQADWLLIEGYMLFDQIGAVQAALDLARQNGTKVALTLANTAVIQFAWEALSQVLESGVDMVFANIDERNALIEAATTHATDHGDSLLRALDNTLQVITRDADGASVYHQGQEVAFAGTTKLDNVVDTTGAGDAFAAGFLHLYLQNSENLDAALKLGHAVAAKAIMQIGARLPSDTVNGTLESFQKAA